MDPEAQAASARVGAPYRLVVRTWSGSAWEVAASITSDLADPHVELLPDGDVLLVARRARRDDVEGAEDNAAIHGPAGELRTTFVVGDGVESVQADSRADIWVAYTAGGITGAYGELGWGRRSPEHWVRPIGEPGLVCFTKDGTNLFEHAPGETLPVIADCAALNVTADAAWVVYHPGFWLVRVSLDAREQLHYPGGDITTTALAIGAGRALVYAGLGPRAGTARVVDLTTDEAGGCAGPERSLLLPDGRGVHGRARVVGRSSSLYAFGAGSVHRVDAEEF